MISASDVRRLRAAWLGAWPYVLALTAAVSLRWPLLALPVAFACLIEVLTRRGARSRAPLAIACVLSALALARFVVREAMPGIVGGGQRAAEQRAISRLRDVSFAQDAMRRAAWIDPDRDGVGSAAFLGELCGEPPRRGQAERATPVLHCGELIETALGPAAQAGGYLYTLCLPTQSGGWSADPDSRVDEERAELRFVAYAWPAPGSPFSTTFFIDEHENILTLDLASGEAGPGTRGPPACDAALGAGRASWSVWRGKQPRAELPGAPRTPSAPAAE